MLLAVAGIHIESSTFSPLLATVADFTARRGREMMDRYPFLDGPAFASVDPVPLAHFRALPGGRVRSDCYAAMRDEIVARLREAGPVDALFLDVHGAMAVEGLDDAEADLLDALRAALPPGCPVTCAQDLHGNVTDRLVAGVDAITAYRTAPHVDWLETRERAVGLLVRRERERAHLWRARVGIPVLVSGEMSSTEAEPARSLYATLAGESARPGVWDASLWVGYAWADQARSMASAVATGPDRAAVAACAERIARRYWEARHQFRFIAPAGTLEECVRRGLALGGRAIFLSDAGDNPTAGAAGDVTDTLARLLGIAEIRAGAASALYASIPDAAAVRACAGAGVGRAVSLSLGGKLDPVHGRPLEVEGVVERIAGGDTVAGTQAVLRCGGAHLIVTERRKPFHRRDDFLALGLDPLAHTFTVVKIGYLEPELKAMARHHFLVLSPGAVNPSLTALAYRNRPRPCFPWEDGFEWEPKARVFGAATRHAGS